MRGRDFITDAEWSVEELEHVFQTADGCKRSFRKGGLTPALQNHTLFMMFSGQSTRTRNSFEAGMTQLGGHAHDFTPDKIRISHGETPWDTGKVLSRSGHGIAIRNSFWKIGNRYIRCRSRSSCSCRASGWTSCWRTGRSSISSPSSWSGRAATRDRPARISRSCTT